MRNFFTFLGCILCWAVPFGIALGAAKASAAPLRKIEGDWIDVVTDLPPAAATDSLAESFDAAVPQWLQYWGVDRQRADGWHVTIYVMQDRDAFLRRGLLPDSLPAFRHGYTAGNTAWVVAQESDYYTRHLVLHEGVHSLAQHLFEGAGPFWFMEGTAELLATHHGVAAELRLPVVPRDREATPLWGRLKLIAQRREAGKSLSIQSVMRYPNRLTDRVEPYAWSWAAVTLLDMYPEYRRVLIAAAARGRDQSAEFTRTLYKQLYDQWPVLQTRWRIFIDGFDYGYDVSRNRVELDDDAPLWEGQASGEAGPLTVRVAANRGWQSAGVRIPAGITLRITAEGRYTLGDDPAPWICEPQGVTIRYHRGRPLGMVLVTVVPTKPSSVATIQPLEIEPIGREGTVEVDEESWLLLQVGDSPAELADNTGHATVRIELESSEKG